MVVLIIGILAALTFPNYTAIKEKSLNREAKASLALIRAAEKIYRLEEGSYYPLPAGIENVASVINSYLKLSLPEAVIPAPLWTISVNSNPVESASALRTGVGADGRTWQINFSGDTDPSCSGGTSCS